jgi:hypothetical protein
MKLRLLICFCLFVATGFNSFSQSVYHLQYNFHSPTDSITYHAFLLKFDDGSGLLRVRYLSPANEDQVVEMDLEELPLMDSLGSANPNTLILKTSSPRIIAGSNKVQFAPPLFIFKYNPVTDYFEPKAVSLSETKTELPPGASFIANFMDRAALSKSFMLQYFSEDEDLFRRFATTSTRGLTPTEKNIRLHLIAVADTLDKSIGSACSKDLQRMAETFKSLSSYLGIQYSVTPIWGVNFNKKNVETTISKLKPSDSDIVVFYYSGHGFRKQEEKKRFPFMKLKTFHTSKKDVYANSLNIEDIYNKLRLKPARLNLVLGDCCNNDIITTNAVGAKPGKTKSSKVDWSEDNLRTLFLNENPMSILACSAQNGQKASSNNDFGSFFSYFFKVSIENHCSKLRPYATWDIVLQDAQKQTTFKANHTYCEKPYVVENICKQNPDYKIVFGRGN